MTATRDTPGYLSDYLSALEQTASAVRELLVDYDIAQKIIAVTEVPHRVNLDAHYKQLSERLKVLDEARKRFL